MTYELALQLKNAGFEQSLDSFQGYYMDDSDGIGTHQVYIPSLSELIEECGYVYKDTEGLEYNLIVWFDEKFYAGYLLKHLMGDNGTYIDGYPDMTVSGETPEEAVSKLYLEINKK